MPHADIWDILTLKKNLSSWPKQYVTNQLSILFFIHQPYLQYVSGNMSDILHVVSQISMTARR